MLSVLLQASHCCATFDGPRDGPGVDTAVVSLAWCELGGDLLAARVLPASPSGGVQGMQSSLAPHHSGWQPSRRAVKRSPPPRPHLRSGARSGRSPRCMRRARPAVTGRARRADRRCSPSQSRCRAGCCADGSSRRRLADSVYGPFIVRGLCVMYSSCSWPGELGCSGLWYVHGACL
jgi:hypothetical protein